jgi:hypothetical protein
MAWGHCFYQGILVDFFGGGGGRIEVIICDRAVRPHRPVADLNDTTINYCSASGGR